MKHDRLKAALLIMVFLTGLSLILYPSVANYWNSMHQSSVIARYSEEVKAIDAEDYEAILREAHEYNEHITEREQRFELSDAEKERYENVLNISGSGVIGYLEIPIIEVSLPIYHGTSEGVLQVAAGHLEWTSLPVGGPGTHCVLSGHRGLPSAKMFTDLPKLTVGDVFVIRVLNEVLTYEVDQTLIVEPDHIEALQITEGEDYCTLVTCTPLGINTHRLLVRGHRIANAEEALSINVAAEAIQISPVLNAFVMSIPLLLIMLIVMFISGRKNGKSFAKTKKKTPMEIREEEL